MLSVLFFFSKTAALLRTKIFFLFKRIKTAYGARFFYRPKKKVKYKIFLLPIHLVMYYIMTSASQGRIQHAQDRDLFGQCKYHCPKKSVKCSA